MESESSSTFLRDKACACKGIRSCFLCQDDRSKVTCVDQTKTIYQFCIHCRKAWTTPGHPENFQRTSSDSSASSASLLYEGGQSSLPQNSSLCCHKGEMFLDFSGIEIFEDFVTSNEEEELASTISCTPFVSSQSGRHKQDFGPKVNFKRQKLKMGTFNGLPNYSHFLYKRMKDYETLADFEPVEMCNLEYSSARGAHIEPHIDDTWVWGERLVTLNLLSHSVLSFTHDSYPDLVIRVPLTRRSLIVVSGLARYQWKHSIEVQHIYERRIAMTFRELAEEFRDSGARVDEGKQLLEIALSFQGCAIGSTA